MRYLHLLLDFAADRPLPEDWSYLSSFRGVFGRRLKALCCIQRHLDCRDCPMQSCYYRLFFAPGESGDAFRPYLLRQTAVGGEQLHMEMLVFGEEAGATANLLPALMSLDDSRLFLPDGEARLRLRSIRNDTGEPVWVTGADCLRPVRELELVCRPARAGSVTLLFLTPLRMKYDGCLMERFDARALLRGLYRRAVFFQENYGSLDLPPWQEETLTVTSCRMQWRENWRKSFRQQQKMSLGGLIGEVRLSGLSAVAMSLLELGTVIHVGKMATFGLGQFEINRSNG